MKSLRKMSELANRFEYKLSKYAQEAPQVSQSGTTELFFGSEANQRTFATAMQDPGGLVYKALEAVWKKINGKMDVSVNLKINSEPQKGASWIIAIQPGAATASVTAALDKTFQNIVGESMSARKKSADAKAKAGAGDGKTLDVGSLELPAAND